MSEARINRISNELGTGGPIVSGITTFSGLNYFVPPKGTTAERPSNCPSGSIRFNTDSAHLEYFDGLQWLEMEAFNVEIGISTAAAPASAGTGHRGLFAGGQGNTPALGTVVNIIEYVTISSLGNSTDFSDLQSGHNEFTPMGCSSSTRGIFSGGGNPVRSNVIDFVTFSSTGDAQDFGDLTVARSEFVAFSSATRGIAAGGSPGPSVTNVIDYITIASTGNAQDFGDVTSTAKEQLSGSCSSTRGVFGGGSNGVSAVNVIEYITISTQGNSVNFGTLSTQKGQMGSCSNSTRAIFAGGSSLTNVIEFLTIATTGNTQDFGDLTLDRTNATGAFSSPTRGVFGGGVNPGPGRINIIDYITIASTGNAQDFGDLTGAGGVRAYMGGTSNGHGGL